MSTSELQRRLARRIRDLAKERGIPLTHLADQSGTSRSHLWNILNGTRSPTLEWMARIAAALDVDTADLLIRENKGGSRSNRSPTSMATESRRRCVCRTLVLCPTLCLGEEHLVTTPGNDIERAGTTHGLPSDTSPNGVAASPAHRSRLSRGHSNEQVHLP